MTEAVVDAGPGTLNGVSKLFTSSGSALVNVVARTCAGPRVPRNSIVVDVFEEDAVKRRADFVRDPISLNFDSHGHFARSTRVRADQHARNDCLQVFHRLLSQQTMSVKESAHSGAAVLRFASQPRAPEEFRN